ncbi:MAG TPA: hypothetical protein VIO64_03590 [Pseudobacteroides sp.]|uniref:hypothetical protein n=1 Tax=Pseudobacteroides sp. TaxID=1968840 RepID=UPI002F94BC9C
MHDKAFAELKSSIMEDIKDTLSKIIKEPQIKLEIIEREYDDYVYEMGLPYNDSATNKEKIIGALSHHPLNIMNILISYIKNKNYKKEAQLIFDSENYKSRSEFPFEQCIKIEDFSILTYVGKPNLTVFSDDTEVTDYIDVVIENDRYNHLSGEIFLKGKFSYNSEVYSIFLFDDLEKYIDIVVFGLLKNDNIPSWIEYMIEGCINLEYKNKKMAFLNIFAAFDNFIELMNKKIFDYYVEYYTEHIKTYKTGNPSWKQDELEEVKEHLKDKIKKYGKETRRIEDKLRDALREIEINGNNSKFKDMFSLVGKFSAIAKMRNTISHGSKVENDIDVGSALYIVLTIILSVLLYQDMETNQWTNIIS